MAKPVYCQIHKQRLGLKFSEVNMIEGIDEWPHSWPAGEISYRLSNRSADMENSWQVRAITVALRTWKLRINKIYFRRERNPDAHVDFNVKFSGRNHFTSDNVLAHAWFPGQGDISGDVEINDDSWEWVPGVHMMDLASPPLVPIMIHEFGHSLGLRHDTLTSSQHTEIMYPSFNFGRQKTGLGPNDVSRIQSRYGARNLSQRILDYFLARRIRGSDFR